MFAAKSWLSIQQQNFTLIFKQNEKSIRLKQYTNDRSLICDNSNDFVGIVIRSKPLCRRAKGSTLPLKGLTYHEQPSSVTSCKESGRRESA